MEKINMIEYKVTNNNNGISLEWTACNFFSIERNKHDSISYKNGSDIEINGMNISIKASGFTLMSGSLCKGCTTFEGIWRRYYKLTHSNTWIYITKDVQAYIMNKKEFSQFVHKFCKLDKESKKNGGGLKIRAKQESAKMIQWLESKVKNSGSGSG